MKKLNTYVIEAGAIVTEYEGANKIEALNNYAKDAGYKSYSDLTKEHGEVDSIELKEDITAEEITNYISGWAELEEPGTKDIINIYSGLDGLTHTRGSMEHRDDEHEHVVTIELLNEFAPYSEADVQELVEFKLNEKT